MTIRVKCDLLAENATSWEGHPADVIISTTENGAKPTDDEVARMLGRAIAEYPGKRCIVRYTVICTEILGQGINAERKS